jgi:hypothetical protein
MERKTAGWIWVSGLFVCFTTTAAYIAGMVEVWIASALIVCAFPVFVLALFAWWMAGDAGGDIPFIGY